jgi:hypothetical protein
MLEEDMKKNKLNSLQNKTLALFQELAKSEETSTKIERSDDVSIMYLPTPHGDHFHIGHFVVSAKDASGFSNEKVWQALERKGFAKAEFPFRIVLTKAGLEHDTGLMGSFDHSDH